MMYKYMRLMRQKQHWHWVMASHAIHMWNTLPIIAINNLDIFRANREENMAKLCDMEDECQTWYHLVIMLLMSMKNNSEVDHNCHVKLECNNGGVVRVWLYKSKSQLSL